MNLVRSVLLLSFLSPILPTVSEEAKADILYEISGRVISADPAVASEFPLGESALLSVKIDPSLGVTSVSGTETDQVYPILAESMTFGNGYSVTGSGGDMSLIDNRNYGHPLTDVEDLLLILSSVSGPSVNGIPPANEQFRFSDRGPPPRNMITNVETQYLTDLPDLSFFYYEVLQFQDFKNVFVSYEGVVVTENSAVPEPASFATLGVGLAALGYLRKRKVRGYR